MENTNLSDLQLRSLIIRETNQGLVLARQLKNNLKTLSSFLSLAGDCDILVNMIMESQTRVLSMLEPTNGLQTMERGNITPLTTTTVAPVTTLESPPTSHYGSSISDDSDMEEFKGDANHFVKRKARTRWSKNVRVHLHSNSKSTLADGHNWRKYGEKHISGTKYPRSYYRCTQSTQGCCARRMVQRSNGDPTILQVTYIREHTCKPINSSISVSPPKKQQLDVSSDQDNTNIIDMHHQDQQAILDNKTPQHFPNDLSVFYPPPPPPSSSNNDALTDENSPLLPNYPNDENVYYSRILSPCREYYTNNYLNVESTDQEIVEQASASSGNIADMNLDYAFSSMFGPASTYGNSGYFF